MTRPSPAPNSREAQLARLIETAQRCGLRILAIEVGPKLMRLQTEAVAEKPDPAKDEDAYERWKAENFGA